MDFMIFQKVIGVIQNISREGSCCTQRVSIRTDSGIVNMIVTGDTAVIDNVRMRRGMRIAAFYDPALPAPAIFPPQYRAELVTALRGNQDVTLRFFDENLLAEDQSLQLNLSPMTRVETLNGQNFSCRPGNMELLVYYSRTTFSIPPQTTPQRIVVICPTDMM